MELILFLLRLLIWLMTQSQSCSSSCHHLAYQVCLRAPFFAPCLSVWCQTFTCMCFADQGPKIVITAVLFVFAGFPDFGKIFNINYNFNFPTINFDVSFATPLFWLGWDCSTQVKNVCSAGTGAVSFNCAKSLSSYKPTFSWGRRKRSVTSSSDNIQAE